MRKIKFLGVLTLVLALLAVGAPHTNSSFGAEAKTKAFIDVVGSALERALRGS